MWVILLREVKRQTKTVVPQLGCDTVTANQIHGDGLGHPKRKKKTQTSLKESNANQRVLQTKFQRNFAQKKSKKKKKTVKDLQKIFVRVVPRSGMEPSSEVEEKNQNLSNTRGLIASLFGIVAFSWLIYSNHLQITIDLFPSDVDRKEDNVIRWFDEHDLVLNFFDYIHCKRFDTFLSLVLAFFIFHWLVHSFVYYLWSFFLDRSTYYSLRVRDRYFITEK